MAPPSPKELAHRLGEGLLSFPVTHFDSDLEFDEAAYREHVNWLSQYPVAGLFAAGGTGEYFSLSPDEVVRVVRTAVTECRDRVPVLAPAGLGTVVAAQQARAAEETGASGVLLFPPYLTESSSAGLVDHINRVCAATALGVIVYNRANGRVGPEELRVLAETAPNLIGVKDGLGDIELMTRIYSEFPDRFTYIGGLPTAETFALPYLELGVTTYSSAMFNFVPEYALAFYEDVRARRRDAVHRRLTEFVLPYIAIRDRQKGYAVSIVKAGLAAAGRPGSPVRPPLTDLTPDEVSELRGLIENAGLAASAPSIPAHRH